MKDSEHFDLRISYKRKEHSKDSNGSDRLFILVDKSLFYNERFWGFKSENRRAKKWNINLSNQEHNALFSFIFENKFNVDHQEIIHIDKRHLRNKFTYIIELNMLKDSTVYLTQTNDRACNNESWGKAKKLFSFLENLKNKK